MGAAAYGSGLRVGDGTLLWLGGGTRIPLELGATVGVDDGDGVGTITSSISRPEPVKENEVMFLSLAPATTRSPNTAAG
jgi:hypothetical protein